MKRQLPAHLGLEALPGFPVVLVTCGRNIMTAAAFSFYSFEPPSVMVGILPGNLTAELIAERREYGVSLPTREQLGAVRTCGRISGRDADKFAASGLTPQPGTVIASALIRECPLSLECRVTRELAFSGSHRWFAGEIVAAHAADNWSPEQALLYWSRTYRSVGGVVDTRDGAPPGSSHPE